MVTDVKKLPIQFDRDRVVAFCRDRGIVRLSVFGSVLREDFDPIRSDLDVLADFKPEATRGIGFRFFGYGDELGGILGRRGDAGLERGWKTRRHLQARVAFSPGCCFS